MNREGEMKTVEKISYNYLRFKLGERSGCCVLEGIDEELQKEIIQELAGEFRQALEDLKEECAREVENEVTLTELMGIASKNKTERGKAERGAHVAKQLREIYAHNIRSIEIK